MIFVPIIDTPGHVDFTYEVSRSLAACEGAILVIDAAQGIEAQTLSNIYLALEHDLEIVPVINKIDLPSAMPEKVKREIEDTIGLDASESILVSAKEKIGIKEVLESIVNKIPHPTGSLNKPLRALIFDSHYDPYKGVIAYIRIVDGSIKKDMNIMMMSNGEEFEINEIGVFKPDLQETDELKAGEVGYLAAGIKEVQNFRIGDTITEAENPAKEPLPGYKKVNPMVFCGIYPTDGGDYENVKEALEKLQLNDASLIFEPETSAALGFGFRCGFLGLLHMEIIQERLEREFDLNLVTTAPSVIYEILDENDNISYIDNPTDFPDVNETKEIREPFVLATIMAPDEYVGPVMELCQEKRGDFKSMDYTNENRVMITYELPLSEIIYDFFDLLKSRTRGYASFDYEFLEYRKSDLVKLDIMVNNEIVDALSFIVHEDKAYHQGRRIAEKLKESIPRHMFQIPIQAAIGGKIIARETISALRKNVLAKCYGGDITRKRKLLERQKEGKKRMRQVGNVEIPQDAFMSVLKID
ncbi:MAG TPA: elongation factor 4 [Thermoanaerobacterales bacterium]|nr:elongation factor 4 [Thermoanaerobacterales bacterium]